MALFETFISFLVSLVISTVIIYAATKAMGEKEGFSTALIAAIIGALIYTVAYNFLGASIWATLIGGIAWLIALGTLYKMGWLKSFLIAVIIWIIASLVNYLLPTLTGPL